MDSNTQDIEQPNGRHSLDAVVRAKVGQQVEVFNQVSDNWRGTIVALNKRTARVRVESKLGVFTNHADARKESDDEHEQYLVPFGDLKLVGPNDGELMDGAK